MTELINYIKRFRVLIFVLITATLIATLMYAGQTSQNNYMANGTQPFVIDKSLTNEEKVIFRLISSDGKEKVEVVDGKFADGTKILESRGYTKKFYGWQQTGAGQSEYNDQDKIRLCGHMHYLIYEAIDPNIVSMEYRDEKKNTKVPFDEINGRRFAAIYRFYRTNYSFEIHFLNNDGEAILINMLD